MGLSNGSKRARNYTSTTNQPQGGGMKKAGLPYQIGRTHWTPIHMMCNQINVRCCKLSTLQFTANPNVRQTRPIGMNLSAGNAYWGKF